MYDPAHPFGRKAVQLAVIDPVSCTGCGWCAMFCPMKCIDLRPDGYYQVRQDDCIGCRSCEAVCPQQIKISEAMADFSRMLGL